MSRLQSHDKWTLKGKDSQMNLPLNNKIIKAIVKKYLQDVHKVFLTVTRNQI